MLTSSLPEKALPGRENAKDWLTLKIVECMSSQMDDNTARRLGIYNNAYNAICQWSEDDKPQTQDDKTKTASSASISVETANTWAKNLQNADGTTGPHWTIEQVKQMMAQRKIQANPIEFWISINMLYSDYSTVAKKHGLGGSLDFYIDLTKAFLDDKDAKPNKLSNYYGSVVK